MTMQPVSIDVILQRAADSNDPIVRTMAIEYKRKLDEFKSLDTFFRMYDEASKDTSAASITVRQPKKVPDKDAPHVPKENAFVVRTREVLTANSSPMKLNALHAAYCEGMPGGLEHVRIETFRQKLHKYRYYIDLLPGRGYWPKGYDVPVVS